VLIWTRKSHAINRLYLFFLRLIVLTCEANKDGRLQYYHISISVIVDVMEPRTCVNMDALTHNNGLTLWNSCFQGKAPLSIMNLIKTRDHKYNLRGKNILSLPKVNSTKHGLNSFKYYAAKQWNMLPEEVRDKAGTKDFFKLIRNLDF